MIRSSRLALATAICSFTALGYAYVSADDSAKPVSSKAAMEKLKSLAGEWKSDADGEHGVKGGKVNYRVTSRGTAVVETLHPGSDEEMTSIYVLDGDDVKMTHYCAIGNHPRMKLDKKESKPDKLVFVFDGGTNFDPEKDMHIHGVTLTFKANDQVEADWTGYMNGKPAGDTKFTMSKVKK